MDLPTVDTPTWVIAGRTERFPVGRTFCVGQNYAHHAREMGSDPTRQEPFFFSKPADAVVASGTAIPFPSRRNSLHPEVEPVLGAGARTSSRIARPA